MRLAVYGALAAVLALGVARAEAELKIAYIDSEVLKERLPEFQEAQRRLDQLRQEFEREAKDREAKLLKMQEDFDRQKLLLSEARKAELETQFQQKVKELQEYSQGKFGPEGELMRTNVELSAPIFEKINAALQKLATDEGYDFILEAGAAGTGLVYAAERYDVTERLLERLEQDREQAAKKAQ
jgi:outer membrane protein